MWDQQRSPVPGRNGPGRRGRSAGGAAPALFRRTLSDQVEGESARHPGTINDTLIIRDRTAWYPSDSYVAAGSGWVSWTAAGPARPELHMRNVTIRTMAGTSRTTQLLSPVRGQTEYAPGYRSAGGQIVQPRREVRVGLHTDLKRAALATVERYTNRSPRMMPARQDRLRPGQYTGQSYSQTTRLQGG